MNNTFLKNTVLALTLGLLSKTSLATNDAYDNELSDSIRSAKVQQIKPEYTQEQAEKRRKMVFSGELLFNIGSYLGRQEIGCIQQVSKSLNHFFNQEEGVLKLWKSYAQQSQLEVADNIKVEDLISQIKNYYTPYIRLIKPKNSIIEHLVVVNYRHHTSPQIFSTDNTLNVEEAENDLNEIRKKAAIWNWLGMISLNDYPFKQPHDYLSTVIAISNDKSDFIAQSKKGKTYKAHIPRYDLWKMK